jgi:histidinol-phosphate aminotransferase
MIAQFAREDAVLTRRVFTAGAALAAGRMLTEAALAQRAAVPLADLPKDMVWLNANENPLGPPRAAIEAMTQALPTTGRYHYQEYRDFYAELARSEELAPEQVLVGAGSSEVLHAAVDAFTSAEKPLVSITPTYEGPIDVTRGYGREVIRVPLTVAYTADVKALVEAAERTKAGLIYLCNPNNPTGTVTPKGDIEWLVSNLPKGAIALIDEAYVHFAETPEMESALKHVRAGKDVVVTRTFSKIHGMAGLRAGFACARGELIRAMSPFRNNVISYVAVRAVLAALADTPNFLPQRRAAILKTRRELYGWLRERDLDYIESHANFVMIDLKRDIRPIIMAMPPKGVAVGRPFPPMDTFLRVSIGTDADMAKFREVFWSVYQA